MYRYFRKTAYWLGWLLLVGSTGLFMLTWGAGNIYLAFAGVIVGGLLIHNFKD